MDKAETKSISASFSNVANCEDRPEANVLTWNSERIAAALIKENIQSLGEVLAEASDYIFEVLPSVISNAARQVLTSADDEFLRCEGFSDRRSLSAAVGRTLLNFLLDGDSIGIPMKYVEKSRPGCIRALSMPPVIKTEGSSDECKQTGSLLNKEPNGNSCINHTVKQENEQHRQPIGLARLLYDDDPSVFEKSLRYLDVLRCKDFVNWINLWRIELTEAELENYFKTYLRIGESSTSLVIAKSFPSVIQCLERDEKLSHDFFTQVDKNDALQFAAQYTQFRHRLILIFGANHKTHKDAVKMIKRYGLDAYDFPVVVKTGNEKAANYTTRQPDFNVNSIIDVSVNRPSFLIAVCKRLFVSGKMAEATQVYQSIKQSMNSTNPPKLYNHIPPHMEETLNKTLQSASIAPYERQCGEPHDNYSPTESCYLQLSDVSHLPANQVIRVVEDIATLHKASQIWKEHEYVGIDAEWKPALTAFWECSAALLQIACGPFERRIVYLVDLISLEKESGTSADLLLSEFFAQPTPIKIGLAFQAEDWTRLKMRGDFFYNSLNGCVDLQKVVFGVEEFAECIKNNSPEGCNKSGLAHIVEKLFGIPMDKSSQKVNWELRPLTHRQQQYAAMDALAVCAVVDKLLLDFDYRRLSDILKKHPDLVTWTGGSGDRKIQNLHVESKGRIQNWNYSEGSHRSTNQLTSRRNSGDRLHISVPPPQQRQRSENMRRGVSGSDHEHCKISNSKLKHRQDRWLELKNEWGVKEWRFVLPENLGKLCKQLRGCGADCLLCSTSRARDIIDIAEEKRRVIITQDSKRQPNWYPCPVYQISSSHLKGQVAEVLEVFDIQFGDYDICKRCAHCNSVDWKKRDRSEVLHLLHSKTCERYSEFWECSGCHKIYWEGIMWQNARKHFCHYKRSSPHASPL